MGQVGAARPPQRLEINGARPLLDPAEPAEQELEGVEGSVGHAGVGVHPEEHVERVGIGDDGCPARGLDGGSQGGEGMGEAVGGGQGLEEGLGGGIASALQEGAEAGQLGGEIGGAGVGGDGGEMVIGEDEDFGDWARGVGARFEEEKGGIAVR